MKVLIQRVIEASVKVDEKIVSHINKGLLVFVGFKVGDDINLIPKMAKKILNLRIFSKEDQKLNYNLKDINGELLLVSQFTLYGDISDGNRPPFTKALKGEEAIKLYNLLIEELKKENDVKCGIFGADMKISLINDGPVTISYEI